MDYMFLKWQRFVTQCVFPVQVELLIRRAVNDKQQKIYTLACVENLDYSVAEKAEKSFDTICRQTKGGNNASSNMQNAHNIFFLRQFMQEASQQFAVCGLKLFRADNNLFVFVFEFTIAIIHTNLPDELLMKRNEFTVLVESSNNK